MNWFGRKFRNAPNEMLSQSGEEAGSLGTHLGDWCSPEAPFTGYNPEATLVTSVLGVGNPSMDQSENFHAPVLDIDIEHVYYPSTTPGHAALLLNVELCWEDYKELLGVLLHCGIIERGFHDASIQRGYSACRTPWTKKPPKAEPSACCTFGTLENGKFVPRTAN